MIGDLRREEGALYLWSAEVLLAVEVHHEHIRRLHELFLHATGRDVDFFFVADAGSSSRTCDLAFGSTLAFNVPAMLLSSSPDGFQHTHPKV